AGGRPLDHRSDLFSLGSVLYELATLKRAFHEDNVGATVHRIYEGRYDSPAMVRPDLPALLVTAIERLLEHDRERRFASGAALHDALYPLGSRVTPRDVATFLRETFPDDRSLDAERAPIETGAARPAPTATLDPLATHRAPGHVLVS